jgi:hypothetical protein
LAYVARHHSSRCERHYEEENRLCELDSSKPAGKAQGSCTIYPEGMLPDGRYRYPKSMGVRAHLIGRGRNFFHIPFPTAGSRITRISWPHSKPFR